MAQEKPERIGEESVLVSFCYGKLVQYSDIANGNVIWYREDTIFGDTLKYTLFRTFSVRVYGRSPLDSKC